MANFTNWLETFISEKEFDLDRMFEVQGESGANMMDYNVVVQAIMATNTEEQEGIKAMLVKIDFMNGDIGRYFRHLAQAIAI